MVNVSHLINEIIISDNITTGSYYGLLREMLGSEEDTIEMRTNFIEDRRRREVGKQEEMRENIR